MYWPKPGIKKHAERRWSRLDRVFFGFGTCQILSDVYLSEKPLAGFFAEWIVPSDGFSGTHTYATNGILAFDFHGYSLRENLLKHYWVGWEERFPGWGAEVTRANFNLLDAAELNLHEHLGSDQFFGDPIERAMRFLNRIKHTHAAATALHSNERGERPSNQITRPSCCTSEQRPHTARA